MISQLGGMNTPRLEHHEQEEQMPYQDVKIQYEVKIFK